MTTRPPGWNTRHTMGRGTFSWERTRVQSSEPTGQEVLLALKSSPGESILKKCTSPFIFPHHVSEGEMFKCTFKLFKRVQQQRHLSLGSLSWRWRADSCHYWDEKVDGLKHWEASAFLLFCGKKGEGVNADRHPGDWRCTPWAENCKELFPPLNLKIGIFFLKPI